MTAARSSGNFFKFTDDESDMSKWSTATETPDFIVLPGEGFLKNNFDGSPHLECEDEEIGNFTKQSPNSFEKYGSDESFHYCTEPTSYKCHEPAMDTMQACYVCDLCFDNSDDFNRHFRTDCLLLLHSSNNGATLNTEKLDNNDGMQESTKPLKMAKTKSQMYRCEVCMKILCNAYSLKNHMSMHNGHKPFKCEICNMAFIDRTRLKSHMNLVHSNKKYCCDICKNEYKNEYSLKRHRLKHHSKDV